MRTSLGLSLLLVGLSVAAASWAQQDHNDAFVRGSQADSRLIQEVRHQLVMLPYYSIFDDLAFRVNGTTVTLLGQVTNPTLKSDAGNVVKKIEGVAQVDNQIEVLPTSPMDDQLRRKLYFAIYGYPALQKYDMPVIKPIRIIVKNGHVDLQGVVDSEADKNMAVLRAKGVPGTFSVDDHLRVEADAVK